MESGVSLEEVTLAALLHDIDEFFQRTQEKKGFQKHAALSKEFIRSDLKSLIENVFNLNSSVVAELAGKHHDSLKKAEYDALIIQKADRLSAGLDRKSFEDEEEKPETFEKGGIYKPLVPIFYEIAYERRKVNSLSDILSDILSEKLRYKIAPLSVETAFPIEDYSIEDAKRDYARLLKLFLADIEKIKDIGDFNFKYEALKTVLVKYLWSVPSNTYSSKGISLPDISLADHLLSTAAIATSLKAFHEAEGYETFNDDAFPKFLFLSVDFSGIQNFIFRTSKETRKWAAKVLRARSFLVSLALEGVVRRLVALFGVNVSTVLMNAGGKCYLILPNYKDSKERIESFKEYLTKRLLEEFYGEIKIKIAHVEVSEKDFRLTNFRRKLTELMVEEGKEKLKLFPKSVFDEGIFKDYPALVSASPEKSPCPLCGVSPVKSGSLCSTCEKLVEIGQKLPKAKGIVLNFSGNSFPIPEIKFLSSLNGNLNLKAGEVAFSFCWDELNGFPVKLIENYIPTASEKEENWKRELVKKKCLQPNEKQPKDWIENYFKKELPKNFCHIALESIRKEGDKYYGKPFLGILKADVDNLGFIFSQGFLRDLQNNPINSVSRVVTLSRMLDFFFTEVIGELIKSNYKNIYSVFSGGDDLFLIGPWEEILDFAVVFREKFKEYTCFNPDFTVSTGIALVRPDLPVYYMADEGESALEKAKEKRNSTVVFGQRVEHDCMELKPLIKDIAEFLESLLEDEQQKLSMATMYKLLQISRMANEASKSSKNLLWRPYLYYTIVRNWKGKSEKERDAVLEKLLKWISELSENLSESEKEKKDNLFYIPLAKAIYRRRKYETGNAEWGER